MASKSQESSDTGLVKVNFHVMLRETILGYVFWSLLQALPPMIWFYPLNELEISGFEAFAVMLFSPAFFGIGFIRRLIQNRWALAFLRIAALACIGSFQAPSTLSRLIILAVGCFLIMLVFVASLWSSSHHQRTVTFWGIMLGLFAFLSARVWFVSFVPTWWSETTNSAVLALGAIATIDKIVSGEDGLSGESEPQISSQQRPNWLLTSLGTTSLLYITTAIFGEVSLVCRWVVKGFPDPGPMPNPWGACVLVALAVGLLLSSYRGLVTNPIWWLIGAASLCGLLYLPTWQGFTAGLLLAVYTMSIWPEMVDRLTSCPPARTLTLALVLYIVAILFSVWTVAYNFVPGGEYTREHTDWLVGFLSVTLGLALLTGKNPERKSRTAAIRVHSGKTMPTNTVKLLLLLIVVGGLAGFIARYDPNRYNHPVKKQPKADFTAAIWTYHFGYDNRGWPSLEQSAYLLNETGADVITLLESDASKSFLGNNDLGMWLGERLGMYVDFGPSTRDHTWGNLILSKYPIVKSTHHLLPSPHGELAPAVSATIDMGGHLVDFVVTHMGNDRDIYDRELQAKVLASELKNAKNPVVFLGYVTSSPGSRDYRQLTKKGNVKDIDSTDADRWCEYIMYRGLIRLGYIRVSHGGLSDTEVQAARFRIPQDLNNYVDNDKIVTNPSKIEEIDRFTEAFGEYSDGHNWITAHRYHMSTPKYFVPKK